VSWWNSAVTKSLSASLERFVWKYSQYRLQVNVANQFPLRTYYCNPTTSLPLQTGQCCFIDCWTSQFSNLRLCQFVQLCDVRFCKQVFAHWAGPMFWWMAKNLMTNDAYDARAAGLLNSAMQIEPPWRRMSKILPSNRTLRAHIQRNPPNIEYDLYSKVVQITNKDTFIFGRYHYL